MGKWICNVGRRLDSGGGEEDGIVDMGRRQVGKWRWGRWR